MSEPALLRDLDWDSRFFGLRIARVAADRLSAEALTAVERERAARRLDCVYFLASPDDAASLARVSAAGWRFVDVRTTLALRLAEEPAGGHDLPETIRPAADDDAPALSALAAESHGDSRFYRDGRFPPALCARLFAAWMERSLDGSRADAVLVWGARGAPQGYVTVRGHRDDAPADIGLFAVAAPAQGRGVGSALLAAAVAWARRQGEPRLEVATQGANVRALRAYERAGFTTRSVGYWYHAWR